MSDNPRMKNWLKLMEEGKKSNVVSLHNHDRQRLVTKQYIIYSSEKDFYVGFWRRFFAAFLDSLILMVGFCILFFLVPISTPQMGTILMGLVSLLYYTLMPASNLQGTLGKLAIGAKIVDSNGSKISMGQSFLRYIGQFVSAIILCIGYIMIASHWQKRALHDLMAGTYVVNR